MAEKEEEEVEEKQEVKKSQAEVLTTKKGLVEEATRAESVSKHKMIFWCFLMWRGIYMVACNNYLTTVSSQIKQFEDDDEKVYNIIAY